MPNYINPSMGNEEFSDEQKKLLQPLGYPTPVRGNQLALNPPAVDANIQNQTESEMMANQIAPAGAGLMGQMSQAAQNQPSFLQKFLQNKTIIPGKIEEEPDEEDTDEEEAPRSPSKLAAAPSAPTGPTSMNLDVGTGSRATLERLLAAQKARSDATRINQMGAAADLIGSGISHTQPQAQALFQQNIKNAGLPVQDLEEQIALEKKDPNSPYSKGLREYLKKFGVNVTGDFTGEMGEKMVPWALHQYESELHRKTQEGIAKENRETRLEMFKQRDDELKQRRDELSEQKRQHAEDTQAHNDEKSFQKLLDITNPANASSRKVLGTAGTKIQSIEGAMALLDGRDLDKLDTREYAETVKILDRVLSNAAPSIYGQKSLSADTAASRFAKFMEFFTNHPEGANLGQFIDRARNTMMREAEVSEQQVLKNLATAAPFYRKLQERNPDQFDEATEAVKNNIFTPRTLEALNKWKESQGRGASSAAAPAGGSSDMVKVKNPQGKLVKIRKSQLQDALSQKYTLAE